MKKTITLGVFSLVFLLAIVFVGCGSSQAQMKKAAYLGAWIRQATYTNGQLMHEEPATMELEEKSFRSSNKYCKVSGGLSVEGNTIIMVTQSTDCPGHTIGTKTTSTFTISDDGNTLTTINTEYGAEVKEIYKRKP